MLEKQSMQVADTRNVNFWDQTEARFPVHEPTKRERFFGELSEKHENFTNYDRYLFFEMTG